MTATTSWPGWARMASIIHSLAIVLAPIRPQPTAFACAIASSLAVSSRFKLLASSAICCFATFQS